MDVVDGFFAKNVRSVNPDEIEAYEEERRLFYVSMTRSKKELSIFRFSKLELISCFSKAVFPEKESNSIRIETRKSVISTAQTAPVTEKIKWISKYYIGGARVSHKALVGSTHG